MGKGDSCNLSSLGILSFLTPLCTFLTHFPFGGSCPFHRSLTVTKGKPREVVADYKKCVYSCCPGAFFFLQTRETAGLRAVSGRMGLCRDFRSMAQFIHARRAPHLGLNKTGLFKEIERAINCDHLNAFYVSPFSQSS